MHPHSEIHHFYTSQGPMSDPAEFTVMFNHLPSDIASLCKVVQGNLLHIFWAERYGRKLSETEEQTVGLRSMRQKLSPIRTVDDKTLVNPRQLNKKQAGNCRDFSLMLTSFLRYLGIPARARCGFGKYFLPGHFEDHWVTEYWDDQRQAWVLVDSQLDDFQLEILKPDFSPLDVPRDQFIIAADAWQMCRQGSADPKNFGIFDMHGWWFIWGNVVRDFLALNKLEILPWDYELGAFTHRLEDPLPENYEELVFYDEVAALTIAGDQAFDQLRRRFEQEDRWRVPQSWLSM